MNRSVWVIVSLVGGYVCLQLTADVCAVKIVDLGVAMPAGTLIYALTFTWRDLLHRRLGREWARAAIVVAGVCNLAMAGYFALAVWLPAAGFWAGQGAFAQTLGVVWRIALASIVAELISELVDTEVYHAFAYLPLAGALVSNVAGLVVDSVLFGFLAFWGTMPIAGILSLIVGQMAWKLAVGAVSAPSIWVVRKGGWYRGK